MTESAHSHALEPSNPSGSLAQLQSRLLSLAGQLDMMQQQLQALTAAAQQNSEQMVTLTRNLTDPGATEAIHAQLAELATQMESGRAAMAGVADGVAELAAMDFGAPADAYDKFSTEMREQLDVLAHAVAKQDQMERLIQMVASEERVNNLADEVQMLIRTQLKANALLQSKDAQVTGALQTLQEIATRREAVQAEQGEASLQRLQDVRQASRAELAADLLPAVDGMEEVLASGQQMVARLIARREERRTQRRRYQAARQQQAAAQVTERRPGLFGRLRPNTPSSEAPPRAEPSLPPSASDDSADRMDTQNIETVESWLRTLKLVHDRFLALLAAESIEPIAAENEPFDPHQHSAVELDLTDEAAPDTVLRVVRKGYRQKGRVLRYAEVVVARSTSSHESAPLPPPSTEAAAESDTSASDDNGDPPENDDAV